MRNPKSTDQQKIDWLTKHKELWWNQLVTDGHWNRRSETHKILIELMKFAGLISEKTAYYDVNLGRLLKEIK